MDHNTSAVGRRLLIGSVYFTLLGVVIIACICQIVSGLRQVTHDADARTLAAIKMLNFKIPNDYFDRAVTLNAVSEEEFKGNDRIIREITSMFSIKYLYSMVEIDDRFYITNVLLDVPYFTEYHEDWPMLRKTARDGEPRFGVISDSYGKTRFCISRFTTPSGGHYIIGADIDSEEIRTAREEYLKSFLPKTQNEALIVIVFGGILALMSLRMIVKGQCYTVAG